MGIGRIGETVTIVNKSGKIVGTSKHLVNVFKEAKSAYREKKAEVKAFRHDERDRKRALESNYGPKPPLERGYSDTFFTDDDSRSFDQRSGRSSPGRFELDGDEAEDGQRAELLRRRTDGDNEQLVRRRPITRSASSNVDDGLAYGELPPPLPIRPYDEREELRGKMSKLTVLLDELNCLQHSATITIANLQKNPDALAAVALTLAEISNISAKMAPGALAALKGSFPAVIALLASPQFLIAAGVGVGVTIVALGGYKIIKRVQAKKDRDSPSEMDELQEINADISRIETWRRGIADADAPSIGTSVDAEFITPHASRQLLDAGVISQHDLSSAKTSRRGSQSEKASKGRRSSKDSKTSKGEKKAKKNKEPSGLPFFLKPSPSGTKHDEVLYLSQYGSEPQPAYSLCHSDPSSQAAKNCYVAALCDSFNPDIVFGEVLVQPQWSHPTPSQDEIRRNGGMPLPPQPLVPTEFIIQLYNPEQQITVAQKSGKWVGSASYEFAIPQSTFRTPSSSALDRSQNDPPGAVTTPHVNFIWKKESKLSKDLTVYFTGKSSIPRGKKKNKEPDIAVALFKSLRDLTIYEPNLYRLDMEDPKGLELVLLLGAVVIRDIYFGQVKNVFNITDPSRIGIQGHALAIGSPDTGEGPTNGAHAPSLLPDRPSRTLPASVMPRNQDRAPGTPSGMAAQRHKEFLTQTDGPSLPTADPRTQWAIDAETARLKAEVEAEERQRRRVDEARRKEQRRAEEAELKRLKKMVQAEEEEKRRRQVEIDKETERLRRLYGHEDLPMQLPRNVRPPLPTRYWPPHQAQSAGLRGLYSQAPGRRHEAASSTYLGSSSELGAHKLRAGKKSMWTLRTHSEESGRKLARKASNIF